MICRWFGQPVEKTFILYFIMRNSDKSIGIDAIVRDASVLYAQNRYAM